MPKNSNNLINFDFNSKKIRTIIDEKGNAWFSAKDVCLALGIRWCGFTANLSSIKTAWRRVWKLHTPSGKQMTTLINEAAVYKLAFRSHKPEAEAFTDWVASEVIPQIRKTGKYSITDKIINTHQNNQDFHPELLVNTIFDICIENGLLARTSKIISCSVVRKITKEIDPSKFIDKTYQAKYLHYGVDSQDNHSITTKCIDHLTSALKLDAEIKEMGCINNGVATEIVGRAVGAILIDRYVDI